MRMGWPRMQIAVLVVVQILGGLATHALALRGLGFSPRSDVYMAALGVSTVLTAVLTSALQSLWQARLVVAPKGDDVALLAQAQTQALCVVLAAALVMLPLGPWWIPALFPGLRQAQHEQIALLLVPLLTMTAFALASTLLLVALRARGQLLRAELALTLPVVGQVLLAHGAAELAGPMGVAWLLMAKALTAWAALWLMTDRPGLTLGVWRSQAMRWADFGHLLSGSGLYKLSPWVDRYWASLGQAGSLTLFSLAWLVAASAVAVLDRVFAMPLTPLLIRALSAGFWQDARA